MKKIIEMVVCENEDETLLDVLPHIWQHIQHVENQRLQLFYFHILVSLTVISSSSFLDIYQWPFIILLLFFSFFSMIVYICDLKWNSVVSEHFTIIQWISEKLGLIKPIYEYKKGRLVSELKELGLKEVEKYALFQESYMPLPIPLPIRIHKVAFTFYPRIIFTLSFASASGLVAFRILNDFICFNPLAISIIVFNCVIASWLVTWYYCSSISEKVEKISNRYKEARKPQEIVIWKADREKIVCAKS